MSTERWSKLEEYALRRFGLQYHGFGKLLYDSTGSGRSAIVLW